MTLVDEQFMLEDKSYVTSAADLCTESRTTAQRLISHYVRMQGLAISQVLSQLPLQQLFSSVRITIALFSIAPQKQTLKPI